MHTSLRPLPASKRDELAFVVEVIRSGFAHATGRRSMPALRDARLLKIILFGSYARGDWIEDPAGRYFSDFDILAVVDRPELTDWAEYWERIDRRLIDAASAGERLRTPHSLIVHTLDDVSAQLRLGRYFFIDIVRDGVLLFEEPGFPFAAPQPLTPAQALAETHGYFENWFEGAAGFLDTARYSASQSRLNESAFLLHQAAERAYHCLLLVRTLYSPKTHKLNKLREMTEGLEPRLRAVWPNASKAERRRFALLNDAYVKARYSPHYRIEAAELDWLAGRVGLLIAIVETAGRERLAQLSSAA
jgi:predicted nucleotidyltransferase/HEPN domain-containing protein